MSIKQQAVKGAKWTSGSIAVTTVLDFIQLTVLARILNPEDFGLMAMVVIVLEYTLAYADMGVSAAIIHRQKITRNQLSSLYWLSILTGILLFLALLLLSPLVVLGFNEPRIEPLIKWVAFAFLITPFGQQFQILLRKELRFKTLGLIEIVSSVISVTVAIATALLGYGVFSLVFARLTNATMRTLLLFVVGMKDWRPHFHFKIRDLKGFMSFGLYQMGEKSLNYFGARMDQLVLGAFLGATQLGYYNLAFNIVIKPVSRINPALTKVAFPVLAKVQNDLAKLKTGYLTVLRVLSFVNFPILFGIAATAHLFVPMFWGEQWMPSVVFIQILSFVAMLRTIINPIGSLILARGRADIGFKWSASLLALNLPTIIICAKLWGAMGVTIGVLLMALFVSVLVYVLLIRRLIEPCLRDYLSSIIPSFWVSFSMALAALLFGWFAPGKDYIKLLSSVTGGVVAYTLLNLLCFKNTYSEIRNLLFSKSK